MLKKKTKIPAKELLAKLRECANTRRTVFKDLIKHIERGLSLDCFSALSKNHIEEMLKSFPHEFVSEDLERARRDAKMMWEDIGYRQAQGTCLGNSRSWYYNMSNRFGWTEKQEVKAEHSGSVAVNIVNYGAPRASTDTPRVE